MSDTAQRIFQLMEQRHVSAYRVSQETGISQARISGWKTGKSNPKQDALEQLADYFGVSVDYLLGRSSEAGSSRAGRHGNSLGPAYRRGKQGPGAVSCVSPFALWQRKGPGRIMIQSVLTP